MAKVGVVGAGAWGTAIAAHATRLGHDDDAVGVRAGGGGGGRGSRIATRSSCPRVPLPEALRASSDPAEVVGRPSSSCWCRRASICASISTLVGAARARGALVAVATKGIEESSLELLSTVLAETMPRGRAASAWRFSRARASRTRSRAACRRTSWSASEETIAARRIQPLAARAATARLHAAPIRSACRWAARSRTSSRSPPASATGSGSATTRARRSSPAGSPR